MEYSKTSQVDKPFRCARKVTQLPVSLNQEAGFTRDISASGMFIVQDRQRTVGSQIQFAVALDTPMGKMKLCCEGEVVRIEEIAGRVGIGVRIIKQVGRQLILEEFPEQSAMAS